MVLHTEDMYLLKLNVLLALNPDERLLDSMNRSMGNDHDWGKMNVLPDNLVDEKPKLRVLN